ncbi:hypothetical protein IKQ19_10950 [Candidatus Saccharibacteria bacterium]|nr:hypothetical protein [Candidatus Saccharibacteria bacterium]
MIPFFKHKGTLAALLEVEKTKIVDVSKYPKDIVDDLKGYDNSVFFFYGYHSFVFVDNSKNQNKREQRKCTEPKKKSKKPNPASQRQKSKQGRCGAGV